MIIFCGEEKTEFCVCDKEVTYWYGMCDFYEDENGYFMYDPKNKCPACGHIINHERIGNAKRIGMVCC